MTYEEYEREGLPRLREVFANPTPYEPDFGKAAEDAAILYHVAPLTAEQLEAIGSAARRSGDDALYLTMLERKTGFFRSTDGLRVEEPELMSLTDNWLLPLDKLEQYEETDAARAVLDHALHSPHGRWAILVSHEDHAVAAGESDFVQTLFDSFPLTEEGLTASESVEHWLQDMHELWKSLGRIESAHWVPKLALTVYGAERGRALLAANGWADFAA